ncbi:MAG: EamA family transporter [Cyanobacteria bacterium P01_D01_bin.1]
MTPVNPESDSDDLQQPEASRPFLEVPLGTVQRSYANQLTQDIEKLEAEKSQLVSEKERLQSQIDTLQAEYTQLIGLTQSLRQPSGPLLPGEKELPAQEFAPASSDRALELPTPSTSQQRRQAIRRQAHRLSLPIERINRGLVLSAIATALAALHYCLFDMLSRGGSWLGLVTVGQLGSGFVPSTALLWLRMLVMVPGLLLLAPQLYRGTWHDLQDWLYRREQLLLPLISSGIALFFSQILLYQSIGLVGAAIGSALFFLYPLTAIPAGLALRQEQLPTPLGLLALVAIAMGALLIAQPIFADGSLSLLWTGVLASIALSLYILLTNFCHQQRCHPIPTSIAQFSTVAVLSSIVLLVKPLKLSNISWSSLFLWGVLIGALMLVVYLLNYVSLLTIGPRATMVAAFTPLLALVFSLSFTPTSTLVVIQWTGIMMIAVGGVALGKEKLDRELSQS